MTRFFVILALLFVFCSPLIANAKVEKKSKANVSHPESASQFKLLTADQFLSLKPEFQKMYLQVFRTWMLDLARANPEYAANSKLSPWFKLFFEDALAVETPAPRTMRCINGGNIVYAAASARCSYVTSLSGFPDEKGNPMKFFGLDGREVSVTCESGKALCNPLLYGLENDLEGRCLPKSQNFTADCNEKFSAIDPLRMKVLIEKNKKMFDLFANDLLQICYSRYPFAGLSPSAVADVQATCAKAKPQFAAVVQKSGVEFSINQQNLARPAEGQPSGAAASNADSVQPPPRPTLASVAGSGSSVASSPPNPSTLPTAQRCDTKAYAYKSHSTCLACLLDFEERKKGVNSQDQKVSRTYLALLEAAGKVCGKKLGAMVGEFGYCMEDPKFDFSNEPSALAVLTEEIRTGNMDGDSIAVRYFGVSGTVLHTLFCGDRANLAKELNKRVETGYLQGYSGQTYITDRSKRKYAELKSCIKNAGSIRESSVEGNIAKYGGSFAPSTHSPFANKKCVMDSGYPTNIAKTVSELPPKAAERPQMMAWGDSDCQVFTNSEFLTLSGSSQRVTTLYSPAGGPGKVVGQVMGDQMPLTPTEKNSLERISIDCSGSPGNPANSNRSFRPAQ